MPENAEVFTKSCKCCKDFVYALAFPSQKMLKNLQKIVSALGIL